MPNVVLHVKDLLLLAIPLSPPLCPNPGLYQGVLSLTPTTFGLVAQV